MTRGAEQARAAASAKKDHTDGKRKKGRDDADTSTDSDDERAAEKEAKREREREKRRRLEDAEKTIDSVDRQIEVAEAKARAKLAKLAAVRNSFPVI